MILTPFERILFLRTLCILSLGKVKLHNYPSKELLIEMGIGIKRNEREMK